MKTWPEQIGNPLRNNPDPSVSVGADLKYAVTPALSLAATVNPDFGQVEADPAVVNLSAFEVFFNERRPFFIEGSGNYAFECRDCNLFYSRRIGRTPRGNPTLRTNEFMQRPDLSTILGAAKLTGRVHGFSLGVMAAATQEESAVIAFGSTDPTSALAGRRHEIVEPRTFYTVSRAKREFSDQSSLGFMLTTTRRDCRAGAVVPADRRHDRRSGFRLAPGPAMGVDGVLGGQPRDRQPGGDRLAAAQHRPQLSEAGRRARGAGSAG